MNSWFIILLKLLNGKMGNIHVYYTDRLLLNSIPVNLSLKKSTPLLYLNVLK